MRKAKIFYALYVVAFIATVLFKMSLLSGCASAPPERVALRSLQVTAKTVDTSMKVAGDLYKNNFISDENRDDILKAYATYQKSTALAQILLKTINNRADADKLTENVRATAEALVALIRSFQNVPRPVSQLYLLDLTFNPLTFEMS